MNVCLRVAYSRQKKDLQYPVNHNNNNNNNTVSIQTNATSLQHGLPASSVLTVIQWSVNDGLVLPSPVTTVITELKLIIDTQGN